MDVFRKILGKSRRERMRNEQIKQQIGIGGALPIENEYGTDTFNEWRAQDYKKQLCNEFHQIA